MMQTNFEMKQYISLVYSRTSDLNKIEDLAERKKIAAEKCGIEVPENTPEMRREVIAYLRNQYHYKFSLLISKEELLTESFDVMLEPLIVSKDDDKRLKNIKLKGDVNDLCSKLVSEIDTLRLTIFTEEYAEESKKVISVEERLKAKK